MTRITQLFLFFTLSCSTLNYAFAQQNADTLLTLEQRYSDMLNKSETYKDKKVIRRSNLNMFWAALSDTVKTTQEELKTALVEKIDLQELLRDTEETLATAQTELEMVSGQSSKVSFLGIKFNQSFYNTLVWGLIIVLGLSAGFFFQRFRGGHVIVKDTQEELDKLQQEYDTLRHASKDTQMKLKRELQTALNRLETASS